MPENIPLGKRSMELREPGLLLFLTLLFSEMLVLLLLFSLLLVPFWTTAVTIEVLDNKRESIRTPNDPSAAMPILSVTPPVKSDRPSKVDPYLRASYEPCNLSPQKKTINYWIHFISSVQVCTWRKLFPKGTAKTVTNPGNEKKLIGRLRSVGDHLLWLQPILHTTKFETEKHHSSLLLLLLAIFNVVSSAIT